jgi:hypothetical protein
VPNPVYRRALTLMEADIGDELVALDATAGNCFGFNQVATSVWRSLDQPRTFAQMQDQLLGEYEVSSEQCSSELQELLDHMTANGLVETDR